ncbi:Right handed beta helix region [Singulisphaera sp. GP187]|uniref:right-handed parallel beta-helix repeat-containing protein n=1 Tax=Singulisphaera sp. GP187 TaxID=1882752 RepID=UPI00092BDB5F|nr:right-handed parallel beta-helix repeat-containing protein [Singulisphaera sp. GP187]SIO32106.1 Right handed beta helix region [Singulisphaera sp. GP187]
MIKPLCGVSISWLLILGVGPSVGRAGVDSDVASNQYPSIQAALDANPGKVVEVAPGVHEIHDTIRIETAGGGLVGSGRIVQMDTQRPIVRIDHASGASLRGLMLTRPEGRRETESEAVIATDSHDVTLVDLRILDNQTRSAAIELRNCVDGQIRNCLVQNYQRVGVDDRTATPDQGFAFRCIIGTGILIRECQGTLIQGNRVREDRLVATPEVKRQFGLGQIIKKNAVRGRIASQRDWDRGETDNWMQGTAIHVGSPEVTDCTQVIGNLVERAGQGFDIHADHVILSQNIVNDALIGMKAMHGSKHVIVTGNQFIKNTLWSIGMMPGASSLPSRAAQGDQPARAANVDGGSIIANNIITDFGLGQTRWIWGEESAGCPIRFDHGQVPENPPLADVIIQGNLVYNTGRDTLIKDGKPEAVPPRYRYAVLVESGPTAPVGLHFSNNLFHPGVRGVSNVELKP